MVILFILSRITPIALMVTYIHTYTLVPISVIIVLQILIGWRLLKLKIMDSVLSAFLSISQPAPYQWNIWYNFKWNQPYLNRGLNLNRRSNSLNSAIGWLIPYIQKYIFLNAQQHYFCWLSKNYHIFLLLHRLGCKRGVLMWFWHLSPFYG